MSIITCTGDRPECFKLCERWLARQDYHGDIQMIVVDDGQVPTVLSLGQTYVRRMRQELDAIHTLPLQLLAALPHVRHDKVLFVEDDDHYSPQYLETMSRWLVDDDLVGEGDAVYLHPRRQWYQRHRNATHCSLAATGLRLGVLGDLLRAICTHGDGPMIDSEMWFSFQGRKKVYPADPRLVVQLKGMPGRKSWLSAHGDPAGYDADPGNAKLRELLGDDSDAVLNLFQPAAV